MPVTASPMLEDPETFPNAVEAFFLIIFLFLFETLGAGVLEMIHGGRSSDRVGAAVGLLGNGILFSILLHYKGLSYRQVTHPAAHSVKATLGLLTLPILMIVPGLIVLMNVVHLILLQLFPITHSQQLMFDRMMSGELAAFVAVSLLAPFFEELLFRGIILRSFLQQYRRGHAIVGSALLFGLFHLNIYQFAVGVVIGLILGWLYERSRSLWPCILLHGAYNTAVTWSAYGERGAEPFNAPPSMLAWAAALMVSMAGGYALKRLLATPLAPPGRPGTSR